MEMSYEPNKKHSSTHTRAITVCPKWVALCPFLYFSIQILIIPKCHLVRDNTQNINYHFATTVHQQESMPGVNHLVTELYKQGAHAQGGRTLFKCVRNWDNSSSAVTTHR